MPRSTGSSVDRHLPMKPVDFLVLLVLADGERHGYGIVQDIASHTAGRVQLVPGNLYSVLHRLLDTGLIAESGRRPAAEVDDARRRYYRETPLGKRVLSAEAHRLRRVLDVAVSLRVIGPSGGP